MFLRARRSLSVLVAMAAVGFADIPGVMGGEFEIGSADFLLDGQPFEIRCGEMHAARIPREYWQHRLRMAHAMGLNTVCAYLFWNLHEPMPGEFSFKGNADMAEFCRLAQAEGLKVILRPGPYSCAEWDFGGFPFWLLKTPDIELRTRDPEYLSACRRYLAAVGRELAPLQITRGGPIIMVQVENEYGSYGKDKEYIGIIRDYLKAAGFEVPLFTCDGPVQLKNDTRDNIFCVVNFGSDPASRFKVLREIRPTGPLMCGEYYPGWFDSWGKPHHLGDTARIVREINWMLDNHASFSIYMVHGGTSFGFSAGANSPPFSPQITSYDYDAPITEAGWASPKFFLLRELLSKHLQPGQELPDVPGRMPVISIPGFHFTESAPLFDNLPKPVRRTDVGPMELWDQAHGCVLYRTSVHAGPRAQVRIDRVHDYALAFLDGKKVATLDRRRGENQFELPARKAPAQLDLLIDTFGRVNYGADLHDRKGILSSVELVADGNKEKLQNWKVFSLPMDGRQIGKLRFRKSLGTGNPAFYRATFRLEATGDTFLDMGSWAKGVVWVNGHNLGRYWNIGPQQTLYCPGPWLQEGENEVVVFEINGAAEHRMRGLVLPILDEVREPLSKRHRNPGETLQLLGISAHTSGSLMPGTNWQVVAFAPKAARYICLEALNSLENDPFTSCAELQVLDDKGKDISREQWQVIYADSEEVDSGDFRANNVFDGKASTSWHSERKRERPPHPHQLVLDLGFEQVLSGIRYLPRQDGGAGRIRDYKIYLRAEPFPIRR